MKKHIVIAALFCLNTASLSAAGIAIIEQSVSGFKTGYAGAVTSLDEPSTIFFNPAGLSRVKGTQFTIGAHILNPTGNFIDEGSTINNSPLLLKTTEQDRDVAETLYIPNVFASYQVNNKTTLGLGVFSPFGLGIEHKPGWIGRYHGTKNEMLTININPSIAYKASDCLTFGVGLTAQYEKAELGSDIDFGGIAKKNLNISGYQLDDGSVKITGDGWAYGFNVGLLYEMSPCARWGVSYRSSLASALKGRATFNRSPSGDTLMQTLGVFKDTDVETEITLPETLIFGFYNRFAPEYAIMFDGQYTNWNRFKELRVQFDNPIQPDEVISMNWKGKMRYAGGFHYYPNNCLTIGVGGGVDHSPVNDENRSARIPDSSRKFWTTGLSYNLGKCFVLDAGVGRMYFKRQRLAIVDENKGNINGHFKSSLIIYNLGVRIRL